MDDKTIEELTSENGKVIELYDYDIRMFFNIHDRNAIIVRFFKKTKNHLETHPEEFTDEDIDMIIQDLKDLSDWRNYRRLKDKLKS